MAAACDLKWRHGRTIPRAASCFRPDAAAGEGAPGGFQGDWVARRRHSASATAGGDGGPSRSSATRGPHGGDAYVLRLRLCQDWPGTGSAAASTEPCNANRAHWCRSVFDVKNSVMNRCHIVRIRVYFPPEFLCCYQFPEVAGRSATPDLRIHRGTMPRRYPLLPEHSSRVLAYTSGVSS